MNPAFETSKNPMSENFETDPAARAEIKRLREEIQRKEQENGDLGERLGVAIHEIANLKRAAAAPSAISHLPSPNRPPPPADGYGARPLTNAEAKPIARKLFGELCAEFDAPGVTKILTNLMQFHRRTRHRVEGHRDDDHPRL